MWSHRKVYNVEKVNRQNKKVKITDYINGGWCAKRKTNEQTISEKPRENKMWIYL